MARVVLVALLALILFAQLGSALKRPGRPRFKNIPGAKNIVVPASSRMITLYDNLDFNYNASDFTTRRGMTGLWSDSALTNKVGQINIVAESMFDYNDVVMFTASLNFGIGYVAASAADKWTDNWVDLAVTGATGSFTRFRSGTLRIYKLTGSTNVRDSKGHYLELSSLD
ncbi:hypothetical protein CLOM_g13936 [Closterium sp. NIES-68]|nr:hypothetical protein CLOM_g131 [Closterium sp. NIES-68]GJP54923.1 hypothetical protein CLOM_g13935 [Closterium sp. NIES-68]GJP54924.1 hypothetical protein CLOM_g13936 [Closterium sp. NIES-68]GJP76812.1 hypothetical protein CLOP_g7270 [Closterium sp. NIES-67]GJP76813.1 hypothetical protein CLOP_g7271 [Closterium sp. NIES-67]